jgi:hypothetical protein
MSTTDGKIFASGSGNNENAGFDFISARYLGEQLPAINMQLNETSSQVVKVNYTT